MLTAIDVNETRKYVTKDDPDKNNPTVFLLGCLDPFVRAHIDDKMTELEVGAGGENAQANSTVKMNARLIDIVQFGLKGIENLQDPQTKKPVRFSTEGTNLKGKSYNVAAKSVIALLTPSIIKELAGQIVSDNVLGEGEKKN